MYPDNLKYTATHQWVRVEGGIAVVGITDFAQEQLGEIVYVALPQEGDDLTSGEVMGSVESVKSISDLYSPVSGRVVAVNESVQDDPPMINKDTYGEAWLAKIEMSVPTELDGLLSVVEYQAKLD